MNILYISSKEYIPYFATSLVSLYENNKKIANINTFYYCENISESDINKLKEIEKKYNRQINLVSTINNIEKLQKFIKDNNLPEFHNCNYTYAKILPNILLPNLDKVLVIDSDTLILNNLQPLYDLNIDNYYCAAAPELIAKYISSEDPYIKNKNNFYFNTGVILFNIKNLNSENRYIEKIINANKAYSSKFKLADQSLFNLALDNNDILPIDFSYNYNCNLYISSEFRQTIQNEYKKYNLLKCKNANSKLKLKDITILHFIGHMKPWIKWSFSPFEKLYIQYMDRTPWRNIKRDSVLDKYSNSSNIIKIYKAFQEYKKFKKLINNILGKKNNYKYFLEKIFSVKNSPSKKHKILTILGIKIKLKRKKSKKNEFLDEIRNIMRSEVSSIVAREVSTALRIQKLHMQTFPQFKNINAGKNVAIIGCGPTVQFYNSELDTVNIALNKSILLDKFNFSYLFSWDYNGFIKYGELDFFETVKNMDCVKFFGRFLSESVVEIPVLPDDLKNKIYHFYSSVRHGLPARQYGRIIHTDIETHPLADFMSVSFAALHFALYTQPKKIYLIGLDTTNSGHILNCNHEYYVKDLLEGYQKFKEHINKFYPQIEVISVNPVGLRGMFKDVYTQSYIDEHPELLKENVEIIDINNEQELVNI